MRALRIGAVVLFVLAVLFVAADRIAVNMAEDEAAQKIRSSQGIPSSGDTAVDIHGFPFLTQIAGQQLDDVDARLGRMPAKAGDKKLTVTNIDAHLRDVELRQDFSSAIARDADGTALISYDDLAGVTGSGVRIGWGGKGDDGEGRVRLTGGITVPGLGKTVHRSVKSKPSVSGGNTVRLRADKVPGGSIPGIEDLVRKKTDFDRKLTGLPSGMQLKQVEATKKGIKLTLHGSDVQLAG